jgi:hypothetical protein
VTTTIIVGTIGVIILMWILTHPDEFKTVSGSVTDVFTKGVGALVPKAA